METGETIEIAQTGFRPAIGGSGTVLSYLIPDLDNIGRPYRWSIVRANLDGSNPASVLTVALSGCGPNRILPCSTPVSPDATQLAFSDNDECQSCPLEAFDAVGVCLIDLTSDATTQIVEGGWRPQWIR